MEPLDTRFALLGKSVYTVVPGALEFVVRLQARLAESQHFEQWEIGSVKMARLNRADDRRDVQCIAVLPFSLNIRMAFSPRTFSLSCADKLSIRLITSTVLGQVATASPWSKSLPMMIL